MDFIDGTGIWTVGQGEAAVIPPIPPVVAQASGGRWRPVSRRVREFLLRGIIPDEAESRDQKEIDEILRIFEKFDE